MRAVPHGAIARRAQQHTAFRNSKSHFALRY
jgi:hypothetical protein